MKGGLVLGFILLLMIALTSSTIPDKMVVLEDDVGIYFVMPNTQISVEMVAIPQGLVQFYGGWQVISYNEHYLTVCFVNEDQKVLRNCSELSSKSLDNINIFRTGDVAINLGLKSTPKMIFNDSNHSLVCLNPDSQRGYRLDTGERVSRLRDNQTYII